MLIDFLRKGLKHFGAALYFCGCLEVALSSEGITSFHLR
jgi:hypothetical protein